MRAGRTWCSWDQSARARPTCPSSVHPGLQGRPPGGLPTAAQWVDRLAEAHASGRLNAELGRLGLYPLLVIGEVGYIPFESEAANLQLVASRYERASVI